MKKVSSLLIGCLIVLSMVTYASAGSWYKENTVDFCAARTEGVNFQVTSVANGTRIYWLSETQTDRMLAALLTAYAGGLKVDVYYEGGTVMRVTRVRLQE